MDNREIDALVAEKVMGLIPCDKWTPINLGSAGGPALLKNCQHDNCYPATRLNDWVGGCPEYSTDIAAAWQVVERFTQKWKYVFKLQNHYSFNFDTYEATLNGYGGSANTAPMAICLAALKAVGHETDIPTT